MNKKILLINSNDIFQNTTIEENVDVKLLSKTIATAQETALKPILGFELYNNLLNQVEGFIISGQSIDSNYTELLSYVTPYLIHKTVADFIIVNNYKISNKGLTKLTDGSQSNLSNHDIETVKDYYNNQVSTYKESLISYLRQTKQINFWNDTEVTNESTGGWFLGNRTSQYIEPKDVPPTPEYVAPEYSYQQLTTLNNILLVSGNDIIQNSPIEDNVDIKLLTKTIQNVQMVNLRPILTDKLYYGILSSIQDNKVNNSLITPIYLDLIALIKPYLINKTVGEFIIINNYKISNKGLTKLTDGSQSNLSNQDIETVKDYFENISTTFKLDVISFLKKHRLVNNGLSDSDISSDSTGWFIPTKSYDDEYPNSIEVNDSLALSNYKVNIVTGGTYNDGTITLTDTYGNILNITGLYTGFTDSDINTFTTGGTYNNGTIQLTDNSGNVITINGLYTGFTDSDIFVVGGTYSNGVITLNYNNGSTSTIGGLFTGITSNNVTTALGFTPYNSTNPSNFISGITSNNVTTALGYTPYNSTNPNHYISGYTDTYTTGGTYSNGTITFNNNTGGNYNISGLYTGSSINYVPLTGGTMTGTLNVPTISGSSITINDFYVSPSTGNVIINNGTTDSGYKLDVNGTTRHTGLSTLNGDQQFSYVSGTRTINVATPATSNTAGSHLTITAGAGTGTGSTVGGNLYLYQGSPGGAGNRGIIYIGSSTSPNPGQQVVQGGLTINGTGPTAANLFDIQGGGSSKCMFAYDATNFLFKLTYNNGYQTQHLNAASYYFDNNLLIGTTGGTTGRLTTAGNISKAAWGLNGVNLQTQAATYTDSTSTSGSTVTNNMVNTFGVPTLASSSAVTYTNTATLYIAGAPVAGTNTTLTNKWSIYAVGNAYFSTGVNSPGSIVGGSHVLSGNQGLLTSGLVASTNPCLTTYNTTTQDLELATGVAGRGLMIFRTTGNVGVGYTTDNGYKLDISGQTRTTKLNTLTGSTGSSGIVVLTGGTATVPNTLVTNNSIIMLTTQVVGGTIGYQYISSKTAGSSFTITSTSNTDISTIAYLIIN